MVAATLFLPAWRLDWVWGWALVGVYALWVATNALILIPRRPELLVERVQSQKSSKAWEMAIMGIFGVSTIAKYILAGLDFRNGWTAPLSLPIHTAALLVTALGFAMVTWAMVANTFFSTTYRLQEDRGHAVASSGPYRVVRHPGYVGTIAFELATPIMLGSLWALMLGGLGALLIVVRTALEDRTLQEELSGYAEYTQRTRYRLLPKVW
jgi:protein-S-isoprenylcysteine O-methyltransferase Ste14